MLKMSGLIVADIQWKVWGKAKQKANSVQEKYDREKKKKQAKSKTNNQITVPSYKF